MGSNGLMGTRTRLSQLFDAHAASIEATPRTFVFRYGSPKHWLDVFRMYYGPVLKAFAALPPPAQAALEQDLVDLIGRFNRANDGTVAVQSEYLEVVVLRR
jgi:hypothetical protein